MNISKIPFLEYNLPPISPNSNQRIYLVFEHKIRNAALDVCNKFHKERIIIAAVIAPTIYININYTENIYQTFEQMVLNIEGPQNNFKGLGDLKNVIIDLGLSFTMLLTIIASSIQGKLTEKSRNSTYYAKFII